MPRASTAYALAIGPYKANSDPRKGDRLLISLLVERGMDGPGHCYVELADPQHAPVHVGAKISIELDAGRGAKTVFTGEAYASGVTTTAQQIRAADAIAKIAAARVEANYADVTAGFVVKDLIGKAGAQAGTVADGPTLGRYTVFRKPRALHHLGVLATLAGADLWTDGAGAVHCTPPKSGVADHRFRLGESILALDLHIQATAVDGVEVWGEGAAGSNGPDAAHWLTTDLSGVAGKAALKDGMPQLGEAGLDAVPLNDGALRTGAAASEVAVSWAEARAARLLHGRIEVTGAPEVEPGDLIGLDGLPQDHGAAAMLGAQGVLRVRRLRHTLDRTRGLRTTLEV